MKEILAPFNNDVVNQLEIGDVISISGNVFCGRDMVLPRICNEIEDGTWKKRCIDLCGGVIFHTAVSIAGVGPTSSNKLEIENSFEILSRHGIKLHLGKGSIHAETVATLDKYNSVYAVIPPVTALLGAHTLEQRLVAFPELGMEAFYCLKVDHYPAIIAAAHGRSIY